MHVFTDQDRAVRALDAEESSIAPLDIERLPNRSLERGVIRKFLSPGWVSGDHSPG
jgi:hypothetical protein